MIEIEKIEAIKEVVAKHYKIQVDQVMSDTRARPAPLVRHITWYIMHTYLGWSSVKLAEHFKLGDHTTVLYGLKRVQNEDDLMENTNLILSVLKNKRILSDTDMASMQTHNSRQRFQDLERAVKILEKKNSFLSAKLVEANAEITKYKNLLYKYRTTSSVVNKILS